MPCSEATGTLVERRSVAQERAREKRRKRDAAKRQRETEKRQTTRAERLRQELEYEQQLDWRVHEAYGVDLERFTLAVLRKAKRLGTRLYADTRSYHGSLDGAFRAQSLPKQAETIARYMTDEDEIQGLSTGLVLRRCAIRAAIVYLRPDDKELAIQEVTGEVPEPTAAYWDMLADRILTGDIKGAEAWLSRGKGEGEGQ